jgi:hypothetical protein
MGDILCFFPSFQKGNMWEIPKVKWVSKMGERDTVEKFSENMTSDGVSLF